MKEKEKTETMLTVQNLTITYGNIKAVDNISFVEIKGSLLGLLIRYLFNLQHAPLDSLETYIFCRCNIS